MRIDPLARLAKDIKANAANTVTKTQTQKRPFVALRGVLAASVRDRKPVAPCLLVAVPMPVKVAKAHKVHEFARIDERA